jgi:hypothetical protein
MTETAETEMATGERKAEIARPRLGEWVIATTLLAFFVFAYVASQDWPFRAALFPQMVAVLGAALTVLRLVQLVLQTVRGRRTVVAATPVHTPSAAAVGVLPADSSPEAEQVRVAGAADSSPEEPQKLGDIALVDDDAEEEESMEYVFATAGGRAWLAALAWVALFFISFFVLGAYITLPLFALAYLRIAGKASWLGAAVYAVVTGVIVYYVFGQLVFIPLPESPFPFLDF